MNELLLKLWRMVRGRRQWYVLWLINSKFIVGVSGVILDEQGRILLLKHRFWRAGSWGLPGGYMVSGERLEEALCREVHEETGYAIQTLKLIRVVSGYKLRLEASFLARITGGEERLDPREILDAGFFTRDNLPPGLLYSHREIIRQAFALHEAIP